TSISRRAEKRRITASKQVRGTIAIRFRRRKLLKSPASAGFSARAWVPSTPRQARPTFSSRRASCWRNSVVPLHVVGRGQNGWRVDEGCPDRGSHCRLPLPVPVRLEL